MASLNIDEAYRDLSSSGGRTNNDNTRKCQHSLTDLLTHCAVIGQSYSLLQPTSVPPFRDRISLMFQVISSQLGRAAREGLDNRVNGQYIDCIHEGEDWFCPSDLRETRPQFCLHAARGANDGQVVRTSWEFWIHVISNNMWCFEQSLSPLPSLYFSLPLSLSLALWLSLPFYQWAIL